MEPSKQSRGGKDLFRERLDAIIDLKHPLVRLAGLVPWSDFDEAFGCFYRPLGRPAKPTRLMVGLHYLKHTFDLSDEVTVERWVENPYWQYFCGEAYFQHQLPIDPSSMSRFRSRIGEPGCEKLLQGTIKAGVQSKTLKRTDFKRITVDTTVQEKAVSFPTDSKLLNRSRERLVRLSRRHAVVLRQSYVRKGPEALLRANRYAHARQHAPSGQAAENVSGSGGARH